MRKQMGDVTFKQDPHFSTETFVLQGNTLLIVGGETPMRSIPLVSIAPDYERIERRFHRGYLGPLFLTVASAAVAWKLSQGDVSMIRAIAAGVVAFLAITFPFQMKFTAIEGAKFVQRDGTPLFEIYRPSKSAYTYDEFLLVLVQRVNRCDGVCLPP